MKHLVLMTISLTLTGWGRGRETIMSHWLVAKYWRVSCVVFNVVSCYLSRQRKPY